MLTITVLGEEVFDETSQEFATRGDVVLELEHSLASLSKWESEFEKPFLGADNKTAEEILGYVRAMTVTITTVSATWDSPPASDAYARLSPENIKEINKYIEAKKSATWFFEGPGAPKTKDVITSELIYYWMTVFNIPFECDAWHINRLFTLIRICNIKQAKPKKMSRAEIAARNRELNAQRKAQLGTKG